MQIRCALQQIWLSFQASPCKAATFSDSLGAQVSSSLSSWTRGRSAEKDTQQKGTGTSFAIAQAMATQMRTHRGLFREEQLRSIRAMRTISAMPVETLQARHQTLNISYFLDGTAAEDEVLRSTAARRLFSRGWNFAPTPAMTTAQQWEEDLDRLQFRINGSVMRKVFEKRKPHGLRLLEQDLELVHFKQPPPPTIAALREKLKSRREWLKQVGLHELDWRMRECCLAMQESLLLARSRLQQHRLAWARKCNNLPEEEVNVHKHIQRRGDIRMNKLDKNLGVVVYTLQREKEAIKLHLQSSNFALAQDDRQLQLHDRRKEIWDIILEQAHQMFEDIDMPKELVCYNWCLTCPSD